MYKVYFLQSEITNSYYIGYTKKTLQERLFKHNHGHVKSTKSKKPWKLVYYEEYSDKRGAMKREFFLKHPAGYQEKLKILNSISMSGIAQPRRGPLGIG